jgi:hypothetical protein
MGKYKLRPRQKQYLNFQLKVIIGTSIAFVLAGIFVVVFQFGDVKESKAFSGKNTYRAVASGSWDDASVWEVFDGNEWSPADQPPGSEVKSVTVTTGKEMTLTEEITLSNLVVEKGAILDIQTNYIKILKQEDKGGLRCDGELNLGDAVIEGDGDFIIGNEAVLYIGSDAGIDKKGTTGNVQTKGKKEFHKDATYVYNGTISQHTGNGLPLVLNKLVIDNSSGVELDQNIAITGKLELKNGIFKTDKNQITLGISTTSTAELVQTKGTICGKLRFWYGPTNFDKLCFGVSDGFVEQNLIFKSDIVAYKKGLLELIYKSGIPDDSKKSPYEARHVVVAIMNNGYYSVNLTNGPDEAWMKFVTLATIKENVAQITWNISSRILKSTGELKMDTPREFSNLITGPNPFTNSLTVRFYCETTGVVHFSLVNIAGKVVQTEKNQAVSGYNQFTFETLNNLPNGDYMVQLSNVSEIQTIKATRKTVAES